MLADTAWNECACMRVCVCVRVCVSNCQLILDSVTDLCSCFILRPTICNLKKFWNKEVSKIVNFGDILLYFVRCPYVYVCVCEYIYIICDEHSVTTHVKRTRNMYLPIQNDKQDDPIVLCWQVPMFFSDSFLHQTLMWSTKGTKQSEVASTRKYADNLLLPVYTPHQYSHNSTGCTSNLVFLTKLLASASTAYAPNFSG